jgi:hypothetical protein
LGSDAGTGIGVIIIAGGVSFGSGVTPSSTSEVDGGVGAWVITPILFTPAEPVVQPTTSVTISNSAKSTKTAFFFIMNLLFN